MRHFIGVLMWSDGRNLAWRKKGDRVGLDDKTRRGQSLRKLSRLFFLENHDNIFGVDAEGVALAEEENHIEICGRTELARLIKNVLRAIRETHAKRPEWGAFCELFQLGSPHCNNFYKHGSNRQRKKPAWRCRASEPAGGTRFCAS